jgi:hypothetical protein
MKFLRIDVISMSIVVHCHERITPGKAMMAFMHNNGAQYLQVATAP